jgi:hypothetical protein
MLAIISAVAAFFNAVRALLGLQNREADRQAGRDEVRAEVNAKTVEKQDAMGNVARPSDDDVSDSMQSGRF